MTEELTADDKRIRAERARGTLADAGWVFDEYVKGLTAKWINSDPMSPAGDREELHRLLHSALSVKAELIRIVTTYDEEQALAEEERKRNDEILKAEEARREYRAKYPRG